MSTLLDLTGQRFGNLTVLHRDETKPKGHGNPVYWICQCDCGNITSVSRSNLKNGGIKSCGCLAKKMLSQRGLKDLTGERFGRLMVLHRDETKPKGHGHKAYWICQCDCGNIKSIIGDHLRDGTTQSCGCLQKERTSEACAIDLTNQQFGFLVPLYLVGTNKNKKRIWHCKCLRCGNEVDVIHSYLTTGETTSCGCIKLSYGEEKIQSILKEEKIDFIREYSFDDCRAKSGYLLRFDFAIFKNQKLYCLIEFQGPQHDKPIERFGGQEQFFILQENDKIKVEYCKNKQIPLIVIPYKDKMKLNWDYLKERCNL